MRRLRTISVAALGYFAIVFGAGCALALVRVPLLVPRFGERAAELMEMPVMLAVVLWAAWRMARRYPDLERGPRLAAGGLALLLMLAAELAVGLALGAGSMEEVVLARDPVSGAAYAIVLLVFALAPAAWRTSARK